MAVVSDGGQQFQVGIVGEIAQITIGEIITGRMCVNCHIRFILIWQPYRVPARSTYDILRQWFHVEVEHTANLYPGRLFECRHQQVLMSVLELTLPGTVQRFASEWLNAADRLHCNRLWLHVQGFFQCGSFLRRMDNIVITSAYGKSNVQNALNTDQILYVDPNKKRTAAWLGSTGLQLPIPPTMYGSMGKITYFGESVKMMKPDSRNAKLAQFMDQTDANRTREPVKKSVRFQLGAPVEVNGQKDLVAVHNLTEENLREALDLGGMPSPSIAVVKAQEGHTKYGPISLVFAPDAIDPMANHANRIYGSDA